MLLPLPRILSIVDCHCIACYLLNVISVSTDFLEVKQTALVTGKKYPIVNQILGWFRPREVLEKLSHTYPGLSATSGMPLYSQLIIALPGIPKPDLVALCRTHAKLVIDFGGVVRGIENHGVRPLPARAKRLVNLCQPISVDSI